MWGRQVNDGRRVRLLMALGGSSIIFVVGFTIFVTSRWLASDPSPAQSLEKLPPTSAKLPEAEATAPASPSIPSPAVSSALPKSDTSVNAPAGSTVGSAAGSSSNVGRQGVLRVSNPTDYPVRVALLAKRSPSTSTTSKQTGYDIPAHWDFAPQEGGTKGLLVSLPNRTLKVKKGDILVAFAQDGSRRYWGPYVVSETEFPVWNPKGAEWQLILQP